MGSFVCVRGLFVVLAVLASARAAEAQVYYYDGYGNGTVMNGPTPSAPAPAAAAKGDAAKPPTTPRGQKLMQLVFDRRPSAILAARAKPEGSAETPAGTPAEGESAALEELDYGGVEGLVVTTTSSGGVVTRTISSAPAAPAILTPATPVATTPAAPAGGEVAAETAAPEPADPEAAKAAEAAKAEAEKKAAEAKAIEDEAKALQRNVTLGDWAAVKSYFAGIDANEAKFGYERLLQNLVEGPPKPQSPFQQYAERNFFAVEDWIGLAAAAPETPAKAPLTNLGLILRQCVDAGALIEVALEHVRALVAGESKLARSDVAAILLAANQPLEAGEFLPTLDEARGANDRRSLNLLARHALAKHEKEKKGGWLETAWGALQGVLAAGEVSDEEKSEALLRAVELAPKVAEELGATWLEESFTARPERGLEILAAIGQGASKGLVDKGREADFRQRLLELQTTAAEALLAKAPELADQWRGTLTLLAQNWLREAEFSYQFDTSTRRSNPPRRDPYGNIYYWDWNQNRQNPNQPAAIKTVEILAQQPGEAWQARVADGLRPRIEKVVAQLLLKLGEEREAFPHIEALARTHKAPAKALAEEFLRVWITNNNPNDQNRRTNPYMFMYGFEQRASGIPLTRSKQERNLADLAQWIGKLEALEVGELDEALVAQAFTTAHSTAEVYRIETIERVFGALGSLGSKTMSELVQTMRTNLADVWRKPDTQEAAKTKRRQKDIQAEVLRGYEVAKEVTAKALADHPDDWGLLLAQAAVLHDENNYRAELEKSAEFSGRRNAAFALFARAAEAYAAKAPELAREEEETRVHELWFYAALGACELKDVSDEQAVAEAEIEKVRAALAAFSGEAGERHRDLFANALWTRISNVAPAVKYRYVKHGLAILPDSERTREARALFDYYADLVTEIRLVTRIDGGVQVGTAPFGVFVDLEHTREIERESGGFGKYLVNQNAQNFSWNYGRPTEDYREKFEEAARSALAEHFEVLSVTFQVPEVNSRALSEYGWRVTPYAYLFLKARGPEVDRLPPVRLDLDFLDTTGYAVLPIESPAVALDARSAAARPFEGLKVTQTLDEREAKDGKLKLEVQAKARGLVPDLADFFTLDSPGFVVAATDDQGSSVSQFDPEGEDSAILSERTWLMTLQAAEGLAELPEEFHFAAIRAPTSELLYQRFVDADLAAVEPVVSLEATYGEVERAWWPWLVALALAAGGVFGWRQWTARGAGAAGVEARYRVPEPATPFNVIGLLREIHVTNGLAPGEKQELEQEIARLERGYFASEAEPEEDLAAVAGRWVGRAGRNA
jgi:hypothetical protein